MSQKFLSPPISKYALAAAFRVGAEGGAASFEEKAGAAVGPRKLENLRNSFPDRGVFRYRASLFVADRDSVPESFPDLGASPENPVEHELPVRRMTSDP